MHFSRMAMMYALSLLARPTAASAGRDMLSDPGLALSIVPKERAPRSSRGSKRSGSIAQLNRHTGRPHEHRREIARNLRRLRQA